MGFAVAFGALALLLAVGLGAQAALSQREADSLDRKVLAIKQYAQSTLTGARLTPVTEAELNSYIRFNLAEQTPKGLVDPYIRIVGDGRVHARATVDLDGVRRSKQRGWLDPLAYLSGRVPVEATGRLAARDGMARFELDTATVGGVQVPNVVLQELVSYYSRSASAPGGLSLDEAYELPARIQEITVEPGRAIVIQR
jgi:hypothetical protein